MIIFTYSMDATGVVTRRASEKFKPYPLPRLARDEKQGKALARENAANLTSRPCVAQWESANGTRGPLL